MSVCGRLDHLLGCSCDKDNPVLRASEYDYSGKKPVDLSALEKLLAEATPGEWWWEKCGSIPPTVYAGGKDGMTHGLNLFGRLNLDSNGERNLDFICVFHNAAPDMINELKTSRAQIRKLREALEKIRTSAPCKKDHESFNSPGSPCDQRIANEALK